MTDLNKIVVLCTVTDWMGNVLWEFEGEGCYELGVNKFLEYDEDEDVFLNSYDKHGTDHGIQL